MMAVIEAILAVIGLVLLILFAIAGHDETTSEPQSHNEPNIAAPYRDGLLASVRLQQAAQEAEQQMYAEAAKRTNIWATGSSTPIRRRS